MCSSFLAETFNARLQLIHPTHATPKTADGYDSEWSVEETVLKNTIANCDESHITRSFATAMQNLNHQEYEKSLPLLHELESLNMKEAQWELGLCYFHGKGINANTQITHQFFQKAIS